MISIFCFRNFLSKMKLQSDQCNKESISKLVELYAEKVYNCGTSVVQTENLHDEAMKISQTMNMEKLK